MINPNVAQTIDHPDPTNLAEVFRTISVCAIAFLGAVWSIEHLDDAHRTFSNVLCLCCFILICAAFGLFWITIFPTTWGWWI